jgi:50S ribosomal protein L16 3-hydroxylase
MKVIGLIQIGAGMQLLGGMSAEEFLRDYWQKKPLLIRQAVPDFCGVVDWQEMQELAQRDEVLSRLVERRDGSWSLERGPFTARRLSRLGDDSNWSLLVSDLNHWSQGGAELFKQFNFIPYARLDDLMVSYALTDGGVGPHFDSYDVFLLQAVGRKCWQISGQSDHALVEGAPLRILKNFCVDQEWLLEPGDMLYLPPKFAHNGIALEPGMTYSIGFRAPTEQELISQFLMYVAERMEREGIYADPELSVPSHPAQVPDLMVGKLTAMLKGELWQEGDVGCFLGSYLSEPKPHVFFDAPDDDMTRDQFAEAAQASGVMLDLKTQMLFIGQQFFVNGETLEVMDQVDHDLLVQLADMRRIAPQELSVVVLDYFYGWFQCGYLQLAES